MATRHQVPARQRHVFPAMGLRAEHHIQKAPALVFGPRSHWEEAGDPRLCCSDTCHSGIATTLLPCVQSFLSSSCTQTLACVPASWNSTHVTCSISSRNLMPSYLGRGLPRKRRRRQSGHVCRSSAKKSRAKMLLVQCAEIHPSQSQNLQIVSNAGASKGCCSKRQTPESGSVCGIRTICFLCTSCLPLPTVTPRTDRHRLVDDEK